MWLWMGTASRRFVSASARNLEPVLGKHDTRIQARLTCTFEGARRWKTSAFGMKQALFAAFGDKGREAS
jgi:hypothetical protein